MTDEQQKKDAQDGSKPFAMQTGLELVNSAPEIYKGLVDDLLIAEGVSMLCGKPKTGKSTMARQLAVAVAEGTDFFGKPTMSGDVLYLSLEGPKGAVQEHLRKLGLTEERGTVHVVHQQMPFRGELGLQKLESTLQVLPKVKLVVIDPIVKFLRLLNSDSYDEVSLGIEKLEQIVKKFRLHLQFLTHGKKRSSEDAGDAPIGSTGFRGGTDTNIFLSKQGSQRVISTEQRWGIAMEPTLLLYDEARQSVHLGSLLQDEEDAKHSMKEQRTAERIEQEIWSQLCLLKNPTQSELLGLVRGKTETKVRVLEQMVASSRVREETDGRKIRYSGIVPMEQAA